jgi:hypothetical protein
VNKLAVLTAEELAEVVRSVLAEELAERLPKTGPTLLDRRGLAAELGCGVDTLDKLRREGLPTLMLGDSPRFELAAVLEWLRERNR